MANLAQSAVTVLNKYEESTRQGRYQHTVVRATAVLSGQGTTTNKIAATAFGLNSFVDCSNAVTDGNTIYPAVVSYDGTAILLANQAGATAAEHVNPVDVTDTIRITVKGRKV